MYIEDFRQIIENLRDNKQARDTYSNKLREVDLYLCDYMVDNFYVNNLYMENDFLITKLFDDEVLCNDVFWFLYDWKPGFDVTVNEVTYKINDLNCYIDYINNVYKLPMKPKHESI